MMKTIVKKCVTRIRLQGNTSKYVMGNLPSDLVTPTCPFIVSGVDFAAPVYLKEQLRSWVIHKAYISIFVFFSTKAVHVEFAQGLTTEAFQNCSRRFVSRHSRCHKLYSDYRLNFVDVRDELNELGSLLTNKKFKIVSKTNEWSGI